MQSYLFFFFFLHCACLGDGGMYLFSSKKQVTIIDNVLFYLLFSENVFCVSEFVEVVLLPLDEFQQKIDGEWISC